jgi:arginine decarboxylase
MKPKDVKKLWKLGKEEFNTHFFDVTGKGELMAKEGNYQYNIHELVKKYGSSLEITFPFIIEQRVRRLIDIFNAYIKLNDYRGRFFYHYPMKVNQSKEFVLPIISEGANLETSSANELWIVKRLWEEGKFASNIRILCNGPKTQKYLNLIDELDRKALIITPIIEEERELAFFRQYKGEVGIRVDLDVKVRSHWDKKFNHFGFREDQLLHLGKIRNLAVLSYHISSQIDKMDGLTVPIRRAVMLYAKLREKNPQLDTIDIGGGAGVPYEKRRFYSNKAAAGLIVKTFKTACQQYGVREPNIICEWGRYIAAPAQITIFKVLSEKPVQTGHSKRWYTVDGSFINDLSDTWAIHQKWHIVPVNNMGKRLQKTWLAGSSCDSDDKYTAGGGHVLLPRLEDETDQYMAVLDTGAYQNALASYHCLLSHPAKLVAQNGDVTLVRKRETPEDIGKKFGW